MIKLKHFRHPIRTAAIAKTRFDAYLNVRQSSRLIQDRYRGDPRFNLDNVSRGFSSRLPNDFSDDTALLQRICSAYIKAIDDQSSQSETFAPTGWWQQVRANSLGPVMRALQTRDIETLGMIYRSFFRNPCSSGLVDMPYGVAKAAYFGAAISDLHRSFYLGDALHRIDVWTKQMGSEFEIRDLAGPEVGNPFGVVLNGTLVQAGATYQHYCAHRIMRQLISEHAVVAEIGGGFGGMAYYLLRDRRRLTYLDFDLPESLALTAYYLHKAFPAKTFVLYGEQDLSSDVLQRADVVLMPLFELPRLDPDSAHVSFSANAISDLSGDSLAVYLKLIEHCTRDWFLCIGDSEATPALADEILRSQLSLRLTEARASNWYTYRHSKATEVECLYQTARSMIPRYNATV